MKWIFIVLALLCFLLPVYLIFWRPPDLVLEKNGDLIAVDLQFLGEYGTRLSRLKIEHQKTREVVWQIEAAASAPALHSFEISQGSNLSLPSHLMTRDFVVKAPEGEANFYIEKGVSYRLVIQNTHGIRNSAVFKF